MGDLFKTSRADGRSDWRVVYDLFVQMQPGDTIESAKLLSALETEDRSRMYRAVQRANRELWAKDDRSVDSVKGVGYRMLQPGEHVSQAMAYRRRSRRQLGNAVAVSQATDLASMEDSDRQEAIRVRGALMVLAQAMDETQARVRDHEARIRALEGGAR